MKMNIQSKQATADHSPRFAIVIGTVSVSAILLLACIMKSPASGGSASGLKNANAALPNASFRSASRDEGGMPAGSGKDDPAAAAAAVKKLVGRIQGFAAQFTALRSKHGDTESTEYRTAAFQTLAALRQALSEAPPEVAAAATASYLDSKEDASTGLDFFVGADGSLAEAPSVRAALMDALADIDPSKSVACAKEVLAHSRSQEEWALALRNLARQNKDGANTTELRQRIGQVLDNQEWLGSPSKAYLEMFDVAAALGGVEDFQNLASVLRLEDANGEPVSNGVSSAAAAALERMTTRNPAQTVGLIDADPTLLSWAPEERGGLMARASMDDPAQHAAVEKYLQRTDLGPEELQAFASTFPNRSVMLGNSLVPDQGTASGLDAGLDAESFKDAATLATVKQWQRDPRFQARQVELQQIVERLTEAERGDAVTLAGQLPSGAMAPPIQSGGN